MDELIHRDTSNRSVLGVSPSVMIVHVTCQWIGSLAPPTVTRVFVIGRGVYEPIAWRIRTHWRRRRLGTLTINGTERFSYLPWRNLDKFYVIIIIQKQVLRLSEIFSLRSLCELDEPFTRTQRFVGLFSNFFIVLMINNREFTIPRNPWNDALLMFRDTLDMFNF